MSTKSRVNVTIWLTGLVAFAIVIGIGSTITAPDDVTWGIVDHQAAATAIRVDEIQAQWRNGGVRTNAIVAMIGDLIFIGIYGLGSYLAGRGYAQARTGVLRLIGMLVSAAAIVFLITDYLETSLQLVQLVQDQGSDLMAGTAATAQPIKIAAWIVTFVGVVAALIIDRFSSSAA